MYLVDTDVVSESRKRERANPGVTAFFVEAVKSGAPLYLQKMKNRGSIVERAMFYMPQ